MNKPLALAALMLPLAFAGCSHPRYYPAPPPAAYSEVARQGFHDGDEAAHRDLAEGRRPDFARHPRFRNPPVAPPLVEDYRHGFRDGYDQGLRQGPPPPPNY